MLVEPAGHRGHHRREHGAGGGADQHAVNQLELEQTGGAARQCDAKPEQDCAREHHDAGAEAVEQRAPAEGGDAHGEEVQLHRGRDAGARPAGRVRHRLEEHREREQRADGDTAHHRTCGDDDPTVMELHLRILKTHWLNNRMVY
jgi:hypothetical protein